jgi:hypothetical protein
MNLLVAGGITFGGVSGTLWLLMVLASLADPGAPMPFRGKASAELSQPLYLSPPVYWTIFAGFAALAAACYLTAFLPVSKCQTAVKQATFEYLQGRGPSAEALLEAAASADPISPHPRRWQVTIAEEKWFVSPDSYNRKRLDDTEDRLLSTDGRSYLQWLARGRRRLRMYQVRKDPQDLALALASYETAAARYPHNAIIHAEWALALDSADRPESVETAQRALRLDAQNHHRTNRLERNYVPGNGPAGKQTLESAMRELLNREEVVPNG